MEIEDCNCGQLPSTRKSQEDSLCNIYCNYCGRETGFLPTYEMALKAWNLIIMKERRELINRKDQDAYLKFLELSTPAMIKDVIRGLQEILGSPPEQLQNPDSPFALTPWIQELQCKLIIMEKVSTQRISQFIDEAEKGELFPVTGMKVSIEELFILAAKQAQAFSEKLDLLLEQKNA